MSDDARDRAWIDFLTADSTTWGSDASEQREGFDAGWDSAIASIAEAEPAELTGLDALARYWRDAARQVAEAEAEGPQPHDGIVMRGCDCGGCYGEPVTEREDAPHE